MSNRLSDSDIPAGVDSRLLDPTEHVGPLLPLLQRPASSPGGDTYIHSAFLVDAHDHAFFTVSNHEHGRQYQVKRAASCLVLPEPGDKVLVSGTAGSGLYIIAVLEKSVRERTTVQVDGELVLAADVVALKGARRLDMDAEILSVKAESGTVAARDWMVRSHCYTLTAFQLSVQAVKAKYVGDQRESYYQSVSETTGQSTRYITGTDTVKAVNLDYSADFIARLNGNTTLINGESLVKADGKQILVG